MKKQTIKFKNNKYLDNCSIYKNVVTATIADTRMTLTSWQSSKITKYSNLNTIGSRFSSAENGIKINKNVSKVKISALAKIYNDTNSNTDFNMNILLNDKVIYSTYETSKTKEWLNSVIPSVIAYVKQNDIITLGITAGIAGNYRVYGGYLTVEEL